jgi:hypothetical protein
MDEFLIMLLRFITIAFTGIVWLQILDEMLVERLLN